MIQRQQQRFLERWNEALSWRRQRPGQCDAAGLQRAGTERGGGFLPSRIDVAEELSRLRAHLDEVKRLLAKGGGWANGSTS